MLTLVCVEELVTVRRAEEERRLAHLVLLAEARRSRRRTATGAARMGDVGGSEQSTAVAPPAGAPLLLADWRRGLGRKLIGTGERLAGTPTDRDPVPAA